MQNPITLYPASVPVLLHYLTQMDALLVKVQQHLAQRNFAEQGLLDARVAADMLPFAKQVEVCVNFSLRTAYPLAGQPVPPYADGADPSTSLSALRQHAGRASRLIAALPESAFTHEAARVLSDRAGQATVALPALDFLQRYALPNFFFHFSMAYAIARQHGVPLGKADFDGLHVYDA